MHTASKTKQSLTFRLNVGVLRRGTEESSSSGVHDGIVEERLKRSPRRGRRKCNGFFNDYRRSRRRRGRRLSRTVEVVVDCIRSQLVD